MKKVNIFNLIFITSIFSFSFCFADNQVLDGSCGGEYCSGKTCKYQPVCKTDCASGCQPGYYLSDGDGDANNNCTKVNANGECVHSNLTGVCEICPVGFYCLGGFKDKIPCPEGKYNDTIGGFDSSSCKAPQQGYCVAKAQILGNSFVTIPSVCIESSLTTNINEHVLSIPSTKNENGIVDYNSGDKDLENTVNSGMANDEGVLGYTKNKNIGANVQIPCPFGTYDKRTDYSKPNSHCVVPDKGYCTSRDGVYCTFYNEDGGVSAKNIPLKGGDSNGDILVSIVNLANYSIVDSANPNNIIETGVGLSKQIKCPKGTYDVRTKIGEITGGSNYNIQAPLCVYPDTGYATSVNNNDYSENSTGAIYQIQCKAGSYDSRTKISNDSGSKDFFDVTLKKYETIDADNVTKVSQTCTLCPAGTYQDETGKTTCKNPDAGYTTRKTSTGATSQFECYAGYYDSRTNFGTATEDHSTYQYTPKEIGREIIKSFSEGNIINGSTNCVACPAGTYQDETGKTICKFPEPGYATKKSSVGATSQSICNKGSYDYRGLVSINRGITYCYTCEKGFYCPNDGMTSHISCTDYVNQTNYCPSDGMTSMSECPLEKYAVIETKEINGIQEKISVECVSCTYTDWRNTTCQSSKKWYASRSIDNGTIEQCRKTFNEDNGACDYCPEIGETKDVIDDHDCGCGVGTCGGICDRRGWDRKAGGWFSCGACCACEDYHVETCGGYNTWVKSEASVSCDAGYYCPAGGSATICPAGSYCPKDSAEPKNCPEGGYCPKGSTRSVSCPAGNYCPEGSKTFTICPAGNYCPEEVGSPISCPAGKYCPEGTGAIECYKYNETTNNMETIACPSDNKKPISCPAGKYCPEGSVDPISCPAGKYCPEGSVDPISCPAGKYRSLTEGTALKSCSVCPAGKYCPEGSRDPIECPEDKCCPEGSREPIKCTE